MATKRKNIQTTKPQFTAIPELQQAITSPDAVTQIFGGEAGLCQLPNGQMLIIHTLISEPLGQSTVIGDVRANPQTDTYTATCFIGGHELTDLEAPHEAAWRIVECVNEHLSRDHAVPRGNPCRPEDRLGFRPQTLAQITQAKQTLAIATEAIRQAREEMETST